MHPLLLVLVIWRCHSACLLMFAISLTRLHIVGAQEMKWLNAILKVCETIVCGRCWKEEAAGEESDFYL